MSEPNSVSPNAAAVPSSGVALASETKAPGPAEATAVATKPAASSLPPKPVSAKPATKEPSRRFILLVILGSWINIAWVTLAASLAGLALGTVRFLFPNVLSEPPSTFKAGFASSYEEGKVEDKYKEVGAWIIMGRDESNRKILYALSTICTHLGCTPNWLEGDKKFKCPCHGSGFKINGVNFEGPAPRPLERYAIKKTEDGQILVDKSRKFQKELGQWEDPDSYVLV